MQDLQGVERNGRTARSLGQGTDEIRDAAVEMRVSGERIEGMGGRTEGTAKRTGDGVRLERTEKKNNERIITRIITIDDA